MANNNNFRNFHYYTLLMTANNQATYLSYLRRADIFKYLERKYIIETLLEAHYGHLFLIKGIYTAKKLMIGQIENYLIRMQIDCKDRFHICFINLKMCIYE